MRLNLIDKLILIAIDDNTGENISDSISFQYAVAAALLLELSLADKIKLEDNKLKINELNFVGDDVIDYCIKKIHKFDGKSNFVELLQLIANKTGSIYSQTIDKLVEQGILEHKKNKILWVFSSSSYPSLNDNPEIEIRSRLIDILENNRVPLIEDIMLISLIDSCALSAEVFGKDRAGNYKGRIKRLIASSEMSDLLSSKVKQIHDTIMMVVVTVII